jgi:hypothetical protein
MRKTSKALTSIVLALGSMGAASLAASAAAHADESASTLPPTWHVHDCTANPCQSQHKPVGFFPAILGESLDVYLTDPARCPDATDKAFLPSADTTASDLLRAGVCMTSTAIIHLRTVPTGTSGPEGWAVRNGPETGYITYYLTTAR